MGSFDIGTGISGAQAGSAAGPYGAAAGFVIGGVLGGKSKDKEKKAQQAAEAAKQRQIQEIRDGRDAAVGLNRPLQQASYNALNAMLSMTNLPQVGGQLDSRGYPVADRGDIKTYADAQAYTATLDMDFKGTEASELADYIFAQATGRDYDPQKNSSPEQRSSFGPIIGGIFSALNEARTGRSRNAGGRPNALIEDYEGKYGKFENGANPSAEPFDWQKDPAYEFRLDEGNKALDRKQAAGGAYASGGAMREAMRYNQNFAANEFSNIYDRLAGIAGYGPQAAATSASAISNAATQIGNAQADLGAARASGYVGEAKESGDLLGQLGGLAGGFGRGGGASGGSSGGGGGGSVPATSPISV